MTSTSPIPPSNAEHKVPALRKRAPESLAALAQLYFYTQVSGQAAGTIDAKRRDLERFLQFYLDLYGHDRPGDWYPSISREFIKELQHNTELSDASIHRIYATVRHFARWAHKNDFPFPHGAPTQDVKPPNEPEGEFKGLARKDQLRLLAAAETLANRKQPGTHQGVRNRAIVHCLLASALRVSELVGLDLDQYDSRVFTNVLQKGGSKRRRVPLNREAREALDNWLTERGQEPGPLFWTRSRARISRSKIYEAIKTIEAQANAHLPSEEKLTVTPHTLRHTRLRTVANEKGVHYARKLAGHRSDRYIWRYTQPSEGIFEEEMDELE